MSRAAPGGRFSDVVPRTGGRLFRGSRRVRLGDVTPGGLLRLDAAARYLQDVASDDAEDAGINGDVGWLVRRTTLEVAGRPRYGEEVELATWCSGTGAAWAERRTTLRRGGTTLIEASSLWVCVDQVRGHPRPLEDRFFSLYFDGPRRPVPARLRLPATPPAGTGSRPWSLRASDFDVFDHVNNAVVWVALEAEVAARHRHRTVVRAEVEYRRPMTGAAVDVFSAAQGDEIDVWLVDGVGETVIVAALASAPDIAVGACADGACADGA